MPGYCAFKLPNSTGVLVGFAALALTWKPVPVDPAANENTTPRGDVMLKKSAGRLFDADFVSGTPSQLISRRPFANEPALFAFSVPRSVRKASTDA